MKAHDPLLYCMGPHISVWDLIYPQGPITNCHVPPPFTTNGPHLTLWYQLLAESRGHCQSLVSTVLSHSVQTLVRFALKTVVHPRRQRPVATSSLQGLTPLPRLTSLQTLEASVHGRLPTSSRGWPPQPSAYRPPRPASMAISPQPPQASVHRRLPNRPRSATQPQSFPMPASRAGSLRTPLPLFSRWPAEGLTGQRRSGGQRRPRPDRRLSVTLRPGLGGRSGLTFRHVLVDSALHLREAPLEVVAARRAAAASGSCNRARRQAGPAPPHHRPSARPLAHVPHLPWRGRDAPS